MKLGPFELVDPFDLPEPIGFLLSVAYIMIALAAFWFVIGVCVWIAMRFGTPVALALPALVPFWVVWRYGVKR